MKWEKVKIKDVYEGLYDGPHATPPDSDNGAVFLGISNITADGHIDLSDIKYISENDFPKWTRRVVPQAGDIVFSYEATLNLYVVIPESFHGCLGRRMALIRPDETKAHGKFLYYYFFSPEWRATIAKHTVTGATVDRIPLAKFPDFEISLPPLEEQHRIASILSAYDDLIENNQKQIKLLEEAAQRLYKEWFVDLRFPGYETTRIVDGVPEGWRRCQFSDVVTIMSGGTPDTSNSEYYNGTIPFYTPKDADGSYVALDTQTHISEEGLAHCHSPLYPAGTVIITARGTVGKTTVLGVPMAMNQSCYALKSDVLKSSYYLFFALNRAVAELKAMANGGVFDTIIVKTFDNIHILIPSKEITDIFSLRMTSIFDEIRIKTQIIFSLTEGRDQMILAIMNDNMEDK